MKTDISQLVSVSQFYGKQKDYTLGGGGNTSFKDQHYLFVKASGHSLATIRENGFAVLERAKLKKMLVKKYAEDSQTREQEVKQDLMASRVDPTNNLRPSVETLLHDSIEYSFVVHTHPHLINGLLCSNEDENETKKLFGEKVLFVPYTDPGIVLSRTVLAYLEDYRKIHRKDPKYIFLQNHGVFVAADSVDEIKFIYQDIESKLLDNIPEKIRITHSDLLKNMEGDLNVLRSCFGLNKHLAFRYNSLIQFFTKDKNTLSRIEEPFIPDQIVYCKAYPLIIYRSNDTPLVDNVFNTFFYNYSKRHGYEPKVILFENGPMVSIEEDIKSAELVLDIFEDAMKISFYSHFFGGPRFMTRKQIEFIENWEAENYRRKISKG